MIKLRSLFQFCVPKITRQELASSNFNTWAIKPFKQQVTLPVYNFNDAKEISVKELDQEVFNQPLRRDLVHRLVRYTTELYKKVEKATITMSEVSASGIKVLPQKKTGKARQGIDSIFYLIGHRQRPGRYKGVKAHGVKKRLLRISLPRKIRVQAMKVGLTAAVYDEKVILIESEKMDDGKTKKLLSRLQNFKLDETNILIVTGLQPDQHFLQALSNLERAHTCTYDRLNILKILRPKKILLTLDALKGIQEDFQIRKLSAFGKQKQKQVQEEERPVYDPTKPLELKFRVLQEYLQDFEKLKQSGELSKYIQNMPKTKIANRVNTTQG
ncbi:hypothetical protein pb186bvf_013418 [Paramecium bursaria]